MRFALHNLVHSGQIDFRQVPVWPRNCCCAQGLDLARPRLNCDYDQNAGNLEMRPLGTVLSVTIS